MKRLNLTLLIIYLSSCFICSNLLAQDTTKIQTFTLQDDERVGVFDFPNDPTKSYEKILMLYTMRCHDNLIGGGNVGCREWDYSCNTFITDSTRIDSTFLQHPTYNISGFSGTNFPYTTEPTYTYTQYDQYQISYSETVSETMVAIGNGNETLALGGDQVVQKAQFLYTADELIAEGLSAGTVSGLEWDLSSIGDELRFLRVSMKHSAKTVLTSDEPDLAGFTPVYFLNTNYAASGAQRLNFYNDFEWDGSSNVIVQFSYTNEGLGAMNTIQMHEAGFDAGLISQEDHLLEFTGNGSVDINSSVFENVEKEITISLWANGNQDILPANTTIFEGADDDGERQLNAHLPWSNNRIYWDCGNDGLGYDRIDQATNPSEYEGSWTHWAFTKNANFGLMRIYRNGEVWHTGVAKLKSIDVTDFRLGEAVTFINSYFGKVDELRIWNKELDAPTIKAWMYKPLNNSHINYDALVGYFPMDEGSGSTIQDQSNTAASGNFVGSPKWKRPTGKEVFKNFRTVSQRPNLRFIRGEYEIVNQLIAIRDSVQNDPNRVIAYDVNGNDLVVVDTFYVYGSGPMNVFSEDGELIDEVMVGPEDSLMIEQFDYFQKRPAKYEILSLVTPYGNGLGLGIKGKTFVFDVTDYAPILKGSKRLSIEMGGQNQEELDLQFYYIEGTPPREVIDIQNIWPFRRGWFADILSDRFFEPRMLMTNPNGSEFKIRSTITGHGQNGEFNPRQHYMNVNGGAQEFVYQVWTECSTIPIYPQGGTWLFDRAGWCPGDPSDVNEFDITDHVTPGQAVEIDYGLIGAQMSEANYLISNQLVTYGAPSFSVDAMLAEVKRPSNRVEFERINPACNNPLIVLRNNGSTLLTSATIEYKVKDGTMLSVDWSGSLGMLEEEEIVLPVPTMDFWQSATDASIFEVEIKNINGGSVDENLQNNSLASTFNPFSVFEGNIVLNYKTNNRAFESGLILRDHAGDIVMTRFNMANNTTYTDELDLPPGCYTLEFTDSNDDGLYYWYWDAVGQSVGSGYLRIDEEVSPGNYSTVQQFESEFGRSIQFDFMLLDETTPTENPSELTSSISVYPNPTGGEVTIELQGFKNKTIDIQILDVNGRRLGSQNFYKETEGMIIKRIDLRAYPAGVYFLKINDGEEVRVKQVVKK